MYGRHMPNYGTLPLNGLGSGVAASVLVPSDNITLFNAESPTSPQASIAFLRARGKDGLPAGFTVTSSAASGTVQFQGSNQDIASTYQTLITFANSAASFYADLGEFQFYRANLSAGTGPVTVIVQG